MNETNLCGKDGFCFIHNDEIIKIYKYPRNKIDVTDLSVYQSPMISFPKYYLEERNDLVGEVMPYMKGSLLIDSLNLESKINLLIKHYYQIICEIKKYPSIMMHDLCFVNVLYSENGGFRLIDVTEWKYDNNQVDNNIRMLDYSLIGVLFEQITIPGISIMKTDFVKNALKYGASGREFIRIIECNLLKDYHFIEMINAYKEMYKIHYNRELKTIDGMKNYTKILKKG